MAYKSRASSGVIPITLGDEEFELVANAKAMMAVSNQLGGFTNAFSSLQALNMDAIATIVRAGFVKRSDIPDNLNDLIFETGVGQVLEPVMRFLLTLQNGGRDPDEEVEKEAAPWARKSPKASDPD